MKICACGSQLDYTSCCGLYVEGEQVAPSPEALMRSRYTAYAHSNTAYIKKTMRGNAFHGFNEQDARNWAGKVKWVGLEVIHTSNESPVQGHVEFIATYIEGEQLKRIHENSEFMRVDGRWYYVDGTQKPTIKHKILRNAGCPCGGPKKYKNCHGIG